MLPIDNKNAMCPKGLSYQEEGGAVVVSARAGSVGWQPIVATAIAAAIAVGCMGGLYNAVHAVRAGHATNPGPLFFLLTIGGITGVYCTALCLWAMLGREKLSLRDGVLRVSNPWHLGLQTRRFRASAIGAFACSGEDCGVTADGDSCCCRWSTVDYSLSFGAGGVRISVFSQLPRPAKDWLRDRLNHALRAQRRSRI